MAKGLLRKAVNAFATSGSQMLGDKIEEDRKRRLARYETDLQNEMVTHRVDQEVRGYGEQADIDITNIGRKQNAVDESLKDRFEDVYEPGADPATANPIGQRNTVTGELSSFSSGTNMEIRQDDRTHDIVMQTLRGNHEIDLQNSRITADQTQLLIRNMLERAAQDDRQAHDSSEREKDRDVRRAQTRLGLAMEIGKNSAAQVESLEEQMELATDEQRREIQRRIDNVQANSEQMFGALIESVPDLAEHLKDLPELGGGQPDPDPNPNPNPGGGPDPEPAHGANVDSEPYKVKDLIRDAGGMLSRAAEQGQVSTAQSLWSRMQMTGAPNEKDLQTLSRFSPDVLKRAGVPDDIIQAAQGR